MDFRLLRGEIVRVPLQFERRASADNEGMAEHRLQGYDGLLPAQGASWPEIDLSGSFFQSTGCDILGAQGGRISPRTKPGRVHEQALGEIVFQGV